MKASEARKLAEDTKKASEENYKAETVKRIAGEKEYRLKGENEYKSFLKEINEKIEAAAKESKCECEWYTTYYSVEYGRAYLEGVASKLESKFKRDGYKVETDVKSYYSNVYENAEFVGSEYVYTWLDVKLTW